jgi:hypothetical protein
MQQTSTCILQVFSEIFSHFRSVHGSSRNKVEFAKTAAKAYFLRQEDQLPLIAIVLSIRGCP